MYIHQAIVNEIQQEFQYAEKRNTLLRNQLLKKALTAKDEVAVVIWLAFFNATRFLPPRGKRKGEA